jgi:hypothetical protein
MRLIFRLTIKKLCEQTRNQYLREGFYQNCLGSWRHTKPDQPIPNNLDWFYQGIRSGKNRNEFRSPFQRGKLLSLQAHKTAKIRIF